MTSDGGPDFRTRRIRGSETQLTREISRLCTADDLLAFGFARSLLIVADSSTPRQLTALLDAVPKNVTVRHELPVGRKAIGRGGPSGGRLDLAVQGPGFFIAVEAKIGAKLTPKQLEGYLRHPPVADTGTAGGLVLVTQTRLAVPRDVWSHQKWLGQVSWDELVPELMNVSARRSVADAEWKTMLSVVQQPNDLAPELVTWQRRGRSVTVRNRVILRSVQSFACQLIEKRLAEKHGYQQSESLCGYRWPGVRRRGVTSEAGDAYLDLFVPDDAATPCITLVLGGSRQPLKLATIVLHPGGGHRRKSKREAQASQLRESGFIFEDEVCYTLDRVGDGGLNATPPAVLREVLERRLGDIVASGVLDHLVV